MVGVHYVSLCVQIDIMHPPIALPEIPVKQLLSRTAVVPGCTGASGHIMGL